MSENKIELQNLTEDELMLQQGLEFSQAIMDINQSNEYEKILTGDQARQIAGLPHEWTAKIALITDALNTFACIRACDPNSAPRYNMPSSAKDSSIKTKSSQSGFAKGVYPVEIADTRRVNGIPIGHDPKDSARLKLPIEHPLYLHCIPDEITAYEILRELKDSGDLYIESYNNDNGKLIFRYKEGRGDPDLEYIINIDSATHKPIKWSRPEDEFTLKEGLGKIKENEEYAFIFHQFEERLNEKLGGNDGLLNKAFKLNYRIGNGPEQDYEVFATKPKHLKDIINFVKESTDIWDEKGKEEKNQLLNRQSGKITNNILTLFNREELKKIYDKLAKTITADQDLEILGSLPDLPEVFREVFNTFIPVINGVDQQEKLMEYAELYYRYLQRHLSLKQDKVSSEIYEFIINNSFDDLCAQSNIIAQAGCIAVDEFVFAQISNNSHTDENVSNLIQHGFDTRNPSGCNFAGPTIVFWHGQIAYCPNQETLTKLIINSKIYEHNFLPINPAADMAAGWGEIIKKQLELAQPVDYKTVNAFINSWCENPGSPINIEGIINIEKIIQHKIDELILVASTKPIEELPQSADSFSTESIDYDEINQALITQRAQYINFIETLAENNYVIPHSSLKLYTDYKLLELGGNIYVSDYNDKVAKVIGQLKKSTLDEYQNFDFIDNYLQYKQSQGILTRMTADWAFIIDYKRALAEKTQQPLRLNILTRIKYFFYQCIRLFTDTIPEDNNSIDSIDEQVVSEHDTCEYHIMTDDSLSIDETNSSTSSIQEQLGVKNNSPRQPNLDTEHAYATTKRQKSSKRRTSRCADSLYPEIHEIYPDDSKDTISGGWPEKKDAPPITLNKG